MAALGDVQFDSSQVAPDEGREALPAGKYLVAATESEYKPTKAGNGMRLAYTLEILEGQYKGRKLFEGFNLRNPNAETVRISQGQLSAMCHAVGHVGPLKDSAQIHNLPFCVTVRVKKNSDGELSNEVAKYEPRTAYSQNPATAAPATNQAGAAKPGGAPWMK